MDSLTFIDGRWEEGNVPLIGALSHASWLGSVVFDGARAVAGRAPDLDRHCARVVRSARALGLDPPLEAGEITLLARDGIRRFPRAAELYIRPMIFAESGFVIPDPASARFALVIQQAPLPPRDQGFSAVPVRFTRPLPLSAPTDAKAACLYPNVARAMGAARAQGFDNAVVCDPLGLVAEFANCNLFLVRDGRVMTPAANGTFLNGITRQRVAALLRDAGHEVEETAVTLDDLDAAEEVFSTGNWAKVQAATRLGGRHLAPGPVFRAAQDAYWDFAASAMA